MAFRFFINTSGLNIAPLRLTKAQKNIKDLRPAWKKIINSFIKKETQVFNDGNFVPLNPRYAARKAAAGFGNRILVRTGRLEASLTSRAHKDFVFRATPQTLVLGTKVPYAKAHQTGTSRLPKRPPIQVTPQLRGSWKRIIADFIKEK